MNEIKLGKRNNEGKPGVHLLPLDALVEIAKVYDHGCVEYSEHNWELGLAWSKGVEASLLRHLARWHIGEELDAKSGLPHDLHIAFNALALVTFRLRGIGVDDRYKYIV